MRAKYCYLTGCYLMPFFVHRILFDPEEDYSAEENARAGQPIPIQAFEELTHRSM